MLSFVKKNGWELLYGIGFLIAILLIAFYGEQNKFFSIASNYVLAFGFYISAIQSAKKGKAFYFFIGLAILVRLLLLFAHPTLSDDIYRFIWDGKIWLAGENPFDYLPSYWIENGMNSSQELELFQKLNSPDYFTIYPPLCQFIFTLAVFISPDSWYGAGIIMKLFLVAFEIGSLFLIIDLLKQFKLPGWQSLLYALNPLVIIEISGNLHFEGAMIFFFLLGIWCLKKGKDVPGGISIALSIASKLLPLMLLPLLIKVIGWKRAIKVFVVAGLSLLLFFTPLLSGVFIQNFGTSLDLYFQKFEFNASIYYLSRTVGEWISGYNLIKYMGPILALLAMLMICRLAWFTKKDNYPRYLELAGFAFCIYLFFGTTIHPWYLTLPIALFTFTQFRFIYLWSFLIAGTYINYSFDPYSEQLWFVILEYSAVFGFLFWELRKINSDSPVPAT